MSAAHTGLLSIAPADSNRRVILYLARDGEELGECERHDLAQLVRENQVRSTDHYWHEGMTEWRLVSDLLAEETPAEKGPRVLKPRMETPAPSPERTVRIPIDEPAPVPSKPYRDPKEFIRQRRREAREPSNLGIPNTQLRLIIIVLGALLFFALGLYIFFTARADRAAHAMALFQPTEKTPAPNADAIRDKATAELKEKIARLPSKASPPQQNFFYDINVNMQRSLSEHVPWWAVIRGGENVINPETQQTIVRTDFILTVEYRDGEWTFKHYRASASDMAKEETKEIEEDEKTPMPPSIVGVLGLKMPPAAR